MSLRSSPTVRTGRRRHLRIEYVAARTWALVETVPGDPLPRVVVLSTSRWDLERRLKAERRRRLALLHTAVHSLIWVASLLGVVVASHVDLWFSSIAVVAASLLSLFAMGMISTSVAAARQVDSTHPDPAPVTSVRA